MNHNPRSFPTTNWSLVNSLARSDADRAVILEELCCAYWPALLTYARTCGLNPADAEDVTQGFVADLLDRDILEMADENKGRLRHFLAASMKRYIANWRARATARKRGGGVPVEPYDSVEEHEHVLARAGLDPAAEFDRAWAVELLRRAQEGLRERYVLAKKAGLFEALAPYLVPGEGRGEFGKVAHSQGMTEPAVRVRLSRLRKELGHEIRLHVSRTVAKPDEVDAEVRELMAIFS